MGNISFVKELKDAFGAMSELLWMLHDSLICAGFNERDALDLCKQFLSDIDSEIISIAKTKGGENS